MVEHRCERCGYETNQLGNLKHHLKKAKICAAIYKDVPNDVLLDKLDRKGAGCSCTGCNQLFASKYNLERHQRMCYAYESNRAIGEQLRELRLTIDNSTHTTNNITNNVNIQQPEPYIKKKIPAALKAAVWNTHIGEHVGCTECPVCKSYKITQLSFNCGHVVAAVNGGQTAVENLLPICSKCNFSMGSMNIHDFRSKYFPSSV